MMALFPSREVVLELGPLVVRWYGLLWVLAFAVAWYLLPRLAKYRDLRLSKEDWWQVLAAGIFGAVVGGRLGYVLLYEPGYFFAHPAEVFAIWDGGMASHGGFIGVGVVLWLAAKKSKVDVLSMFDVVAVPVALGLALGRVGNFINQELFSPPALAWLAIAKNVSIAAATYLTLRRSVQPGAALAGFLISYGLLRFLVEFVRLQEFAGAFGLTRGQLYTLPVIVVGGLLWICQVVKIRSLRDAKRVILNRISTTWYGSKNSRKIT